MSGYPTNQDLARAHGERDTKGSASHTPESGDIHAADLAAACSKWQIPCVEGRGKGTICETEVQIGNSGLTGVGSYKRPIKQPILSGQYS